MQSSGGNIYLVGPMGSGKTAVGRLLARRLGLDFYDSDQEIEARTGVDIPFIFEREGEAGFRQREREVLAELCALPGVLVSTGGGSILDPETRQLLGETGLVVYLDTSIEEQLRRTSRNQNRPLLHDDNPRAVLERLRSERMPLYESIARLRLDTSGKRVRHVAAHIERMLRDHPH